MTRTKSGRTRARASKAAWTLADQVLSSGTNFALTLLVARSVSASEFGAFAVVMSVYLICVGLGRSSVSEPNVLSLGRAGGLTQESMAAGLGAMIVLASVAGLIAVGAAAIISARDLSIMLIVLAVGLPGLLAQDYRRIVFFALGKPHRACMSDLLWAVLQLTGIAVVAAVGMRSPIIFLAIWAASGLLSGILWPSVTRGWSLRQGIRWLRRERSLILPLAGEGLLFQLGNQISLFILGGMTGLAQTGAYRGAQSLFGPVTVVGQGLRTAALPVLMRRSRRSVNQALRMAAQFGLGLLTISLFWGAVLIVLPSGAGRELLGRTWPLAAPLFGLVMIDRAANAFSLGSALQLRILLRPRYIFAVRIVVTVVGLVAAVVGAALAGAWGVALGFAITSPLLSLVWLFAVHRARKRGGRPRDATAVVDQDAVGIPEVALTTTEPIPSETSLSAMPPSGRPSRRLFRLLAARGAARR